MAPNLADPDVEPTDEELQGLSTRAFAAAKERRGAILERLREEIARARHEAIARVHTLLAATPG